MQQIKSLIESKQDTKVNILILSFYISIKILKYYPFKQKQNVEIEPQTTDDEIIILEEDSAISIETISNQEIQNSNINTKSMHSLINKATQTDEIPNLLEPSQVNTKKVIISF